VLDIRSKDTGPVPCSRKDRLCALDTDSSPVNTANRQMVRQGLDGTLAYESDFPFNSSMTDGKSVICV
jgi:hypothetical protein